MKNIIPGILTWTPKKFIVIQREAKRRSVEYLANVHSKLGQSFDGCFLCFKLNCPADLHILRKFLFFFGQQSGRNCASSQAWWESSSRDTGNPGTWIPPLISHDPLGLWNDILCPDHPISKGAVPLRPNSHWTRANSSSNPLMLLVCCVDTTIHGSVCLSFVCVLCGSGPKDVISHRHRLCRLGSFIQGWQEEGEILSDCPVCLVG